MASKLSVNEKANALLWMLMQLHLSKVNSSIVKGGHTELDSNFGVAKVCMDCTNGDTIEFSVNDSDAVVRVVLTLKQVETKSDKPIKGEMSYPIDRWSDEFESSKISAYMSKLMYIVKDVYAMYKDCTFAEKCTWCTPNE